MDLRDLEKAAKQQGWRIETTKRGHPRFVPADPTKPKVVFSGTPGDWRAIHNFVAQLRRSGLVWPWPQGKGR